jgi:nitroimidazol reductase NimA-like FMN-containing flavoprotein (pyridoxamine 5'-phosphate oxidase superfamily)
MRNDRTLWPLVVRSGSCVGIVSPVSTVDEFLGRPLVAHVATSGPTVRPVWFVWEDQAFWWLTGPWSALGRHLSRDPRVALVVDTCDLDTGEVLQVVASGSAEMMPLDRERARRKLAKYLGVDVGGWPNRFVEPLEDPATGMVRLRPDHPLVLRDLSYTP